MVWWCYVVDTVQAGCRRLGVGLVSLLAVGGGRRAELLVCPIGSVGLGLQQCGGPLCPGEPGEVAGGSRRGSWWPECSRRRGMQAPGGWMWLYPHAPGGAGDREELARPLSPDAAEHPSRIRSSPRSGQEWLDTLSWIPGTLVQGHRHPVEFARPSKPAAGGGGLPGVRRGEGCVS